MALKQLHKSLRFWGYDAVKAAWSFAPEQQKALEAREVPMMSSLHWAKELLQPRSEYPSQKMADIYGEKKKYFLSMVWEFFW